MKKTLLVLAFILTMAECSLAQNWTYVSNSGTTFILYGMSFPPGQNTIGYACGMQYTFDADGVIVKTVDGGENWTQIWPTSGAIDGLQGIWFTSDLVGFACGWNNYFIKTTDGGTTWTPISVGSDVWYYTDVEFWDSNNGIAVASMNTSGSQAAFITSNGGSTWVPASSGLGVNDVMGISYASQNLVFAAGTSGSMYKSTDGGHNWTIGSTLPAMLFGVDFLDASFGIAGGEENIFATNNGGSSWSTYTTGYENFYGTLALTGGTGYCAGTDENFYKTENFGTNWAMDYNGSGSSTIYRIRATANGTLFACGSQGRIMKMIPPLEADFTASPVSVCPGGTVNFYDNSTGAIDTWSWVFEGGNPPASTIENPVVTYNTPGIYDVQLTIISGSSNNTELKTDFITVLGALVQPETASGPADVCGDYSYQYFIPSVQYAESYEWEVNPESAGVMTGNDTIATFQVFNNYEGSYTIRVRAENQCGISEWSPDFNGTSHHNPVKFDLLGDGSYCEGEEGEEITLSDSETGVSYELFKNEISTGIVIAGTGDPVSFGLIDETGLYTAVGFTDYCTENMIGQVYVHPVPLPEPLVSGPDYVCDFGEAEYETADNPGSTYAWEVTGGTITSGDGTPQINVFWENSGEGTVRVTEVNYALCEAVSEVFLVTIDDCTGLDEPASENIFIYPNPATDRVFITGLNHAEIKIYNLLGIQVLIYEDINGQLMINSSVLEQGIYLVKVVQDGEMSVIHLVKK